MQEKHHNTSVNNSGRYLNMDIIRYFLATAVIVAHYNILVGTDYMWPMSSGTAVGAFFGLSGFLVYSSYEKRQDWRQYVKSRTRRILPAYCFIVIACAFGLVSASTLSAADYFCHNDLWKYLISNLCFMNFVQPTLPGVFAGSAIPAVNGSLWTLKVEWMLYLSIPIVFWLSRKLRLGRTRTILVLSLLSVIYRQGMEHLFLTTGKELYHILSYQFAGQMIYFFTGALFHHHLPWISENRKKVLLLALTGTAITLSTESLCNSMIFSSLNETVFQVSVVCLILSLSILPPIWKGIGKIGNCSYEMYLFHFPVIHLAVFMGISQHFSPTLSFGLVFAVIFIFSWLFNKTYEAIRRLR